MFYERWDFAINKAFGSSLPVWSIIEAHQKEKSEFCPFTALTLPHFQCTYIYKVLGQGHHLRYCTEPVAVEKGALKLYYNEEKTV